jgi:hypothetical protein
MKRSLYVYSLIVILIIFVIIYKNFTSNDSYFDASSNSYFDGDNNVVILHNFSINDVPDKSPITKKDLDIYIKLMPETAFFTDSIFGNTITDKNLAKRTFNQYNIDLYRFYFIRLKIFLYLYAINNIKLDFSKTHSSIKPLSEELDLIKLNENSLINAHKQYEINKEKYFE